MTTSVCVAMQRWLPVLLVIAMTSSGFALADSDHDRARRALEAGEVLSLRTVLERVQRDFPGEVIEVELEHEDDHWVYEIKVLRSGGGLLKLEVDARDARVLRVKGRDIRPGGERERH